MAWRWRWSSSRRWSSSVSAPASRAISRGRSPRPTRANLPTSRRVRPRTRPLRHGDPPHAPNRRHPLTAAQRRGVCLLRGDPRRLRCAADLRGSTPALLAAGLRARGRRRADGRPLSAPAVRIHGDRASLQRDPELYPTRLPAVGHVVAAPTDPDDWSAVPTPDQLHAFLIPGDRGIMLWRGTWHALTRFPVRPEGAAFALITGHDNQRELEQQKVSGVQPRLTHEIDYLKRSATRFKVTDPDGLMSSTQG